MGKPKYDPPTFTFPYRIRKRLNLLSEPVIFDFTPDPDGQPAYTERGIRCSALRAKPNDRLLEAAWPSVRRLMLTKKQNKDKFDSDRIERIDRMIEASNATMYSKLSNRVIDLRNQGNKDVRKKRGWSESDWKKHMDYIGQISNPRRIPLPEDVNRGPKQPLKYFLPRINEISWLPEFRMYRRVSKEIWYKNPEKVSPAALKYQASDRVKKLAVARVIPVPD